MRSAHPWLAGLLAVTLTLAAAGMAAAAPVRYFFHGTVTDDAEASGHQSFAGFLRFDSAAADQLGADPSAGVYAMPLNAGFGLAVSFDLGAAVFATHSATVSVLDDYAGADWFLPLGYTSAAQTTSIALELIDPSAGSFASDALPPGLPALAGFASARLIFHSPEFGLIGRIDEWVCDYGCQATEPTTPGQVPEPGSLALAALALLAARRAAFTSAPRAIKGLARRTGRRPQRREGSISVFAPVARWA